MVDAESEVRAPVLVRPRRFLPRTRLLHLAVPGEDWTLCRRSRPGENAEPDELGKVVGGIETTLCSRCETRRRLLESGKPIGRQPQHS